MAAFFTVLHGASVAGQVMSASGYPDNTPPGRRCTECGTKILYLVPSPEKKKGESLVCPACGKSPEFSAKMGGAEFE